VQIEFDTERNNWGQININLVNEWDKLGRGAERFLVLQYEEAPLPNLSHALEINVDLTPIVYITVKKISCTSSCLKPAATYALLVSRP
jgi:hypothetical protein